MKIKLLTFVLILSLVGLLGINSESYANVSPTPTENLAAQVNNSNDDSDKDSYSDLCEVLHKSDPQDKESTPKENITINVPSDVKTIQEAINASIDGDTIAVSQGKYKGNINFNGKSITLTSTEPQSSDVSDVVANTIIEGTESGSVITIDSNSVLKGFTITSGNVDCRGIYVKDASPLIENCTIIDNKTSALGGGIYSTDNSNPQITNCIISGNKDSGTTGESAQIGGGGTPIISISLINGYGLVDKPTVPTPTPTPKTPATEPISTPTESATTETGDSGAGTSTPEESTALTPVIEPTTTKPETTVIEPFFAERLPAILEGFSLPCGIHYDSVSEYIYVTDSDNHSIVKTKINGDGWETWGTDGSGVGQFSYPRDIYYDNGYIYVADSGNNRIVCEHHSTVMPFVAESPPFGGWIWSLTSDADYVYAGGDNYPNFNVRKYLKSNMSLVAESPSGVSIHALASDDTYIYAGGSGGGDYDTVRKYRKSDMSLVAESLPGNSIWAITLDDTYVYVGGHWWGIETPLVRKHLKSDLSLVAESPSSACYVLALTSDDTYIYMGGDYNYSLLKFLKSDMTVVDGADSYSVYALASDDTYIYAGGSGGRVKKYLKSDMSLVAYSPSYGWIEALASDDTYIYAGGDFGDNNSTVCKYLKSDMSFVAESPLYGGQILALTSDDTYIYAGGLKPTVTVRKYLK